MTGPHDLRAAVEGSRLPDGVGIDELAAAWRAVRAGCFQPDRMHRMDADRFDAAGSTVGRDVGVWCPQPQERVMAVVGAAGQVGASTVALATGLACGTQQVESTQTQLSGSGWCRVLECCSAVVSGLAGVATAELGVVPPGWRRGERDGVLVERTVGPLADAGAVPLPAAPRGGVAPGLTIVDVGWDLFGLCAAGGWLADLLSWAPVLVVTRASVPGLRRAEATLRQLQRGRTPADVGLPVVGLAVLGPPRRRWPRGVEQSAGPLTRALLDDPAGRDRLIGVPLDQGLAVHGVDSEPIPEPVLAACRGLAAACPEQTIPARYGPGRGGSTCEGSGVAVEEQGGERGPAVRVPRGRVVAGEEPVAAGGVE